MKIVVCCKIVPDEEQIQVRADRSLALENVPWKISQYDLNALEAAKKLSAEAHGSVVALSGGSTPALEPTKIRKDVLSRGADELALVIDDSHAYADSLETAKALAAAYDASPSHSAENVRFYDLISYFFLLNKAFCLCKLPLRHKS